MSMWWNIDIKDGVISHDSISWINDDFKITEDTVFDLSSDLLQIKFNDQILLDVGWYPDLNVNGRFRILLIKNTNWEFPLLNVQCSNIKELKQNISYIIANERG